MSMFVIFVLHKDWESGNPKQSPILRAVLAIRNTKRTADNKNEGKSCSLGEESKSFKGTFEETTAATLDSLLTQLNVFLLSNLFEYKNTMFISGS